MENNVQGLSQGFNSSSGIDGGSAISNILILLVVVAVIYGAYRLYLYVSSQQYVKLPKSSPLNKNIMSQLIVTKPSEVNSAQRKVISDVIAEFKKREFLAAAVPFTVLEKFAEYLYLNMNRFKFDASDAKKMMAATYPIVPNVKIEIEVVIDGSLFIFDQRVLSVHGNKIVVEKIDPFPVKIGTDVQINFSKGMEFITGESRFDGIHVDRMTFAYPQNLKISNERHYARIPVRNVEGKIFSAQMSEPFDVSIIDISVEGIKIRTSNILRKKTVYNLSFSNVVNGINCSFENIEAIVSKSVVVEKGYNGYGMAFLYLDIETRQRLVTFLRTMAEIIRKSSLR